MTTPGITPKKTATDIKPVPVKSKETEFEEEEIEYYEEDEESEETSKRAQDHLMKEEKRKLRALLEQN